MRFILPFLSNICDPRQNADIVEMTCMCNTEKSRVWRMYSLMPSYIQFSCSTASQSSPRGLPISNQDGSGSCDYGVVPVVANGGGCRKRYAKVRSGADKHEIYAR